MKLIQYKSNFYSCYTISFKFLSCQKGNKTVAVLALTKARYIWPFININTILNGKGSSSQFCTTWVQTCYIINNPIFRFLFHHCWLLLLLFLWIVVSSRDYTESCKLQCKTSLCLLNTCKYISTCILSCWVSYSLLVSTISCDRVRWRWFAWCCQTLLTVVL